MTVTMRELREALERILWGGCTQADLDLQTAVMEGRITVVPVEKKQ